MTDDHHDTEDFCCPAAARGEGHTEICPAFDQNDPARHGQIIVLDIGAANQRELERRLAEGEPLPEGVTADDVRRWHDEYSGPVVSGLTAVNAAMDAGILDVLSADPAERCPAACGLPADADPESRSRVACKVHPDGAHRCFRRPRHQYQQHAETGGKLSPADHQCDCDFVWLNLTGGLAAHVDALNRATKSGAEAAARKAEDGRRRILSGFARWADREVPSGHAAGQVVALLADAVIVDFGPEFAWFRPEKFPTVVVGDFVTVGPAVSRWHIEPRGKTR